MNTKSSWWAGVAVLVASGCASNPPPRELLDARAVYARLATTNAPKLTPKAVQDARVALAAAQESYEAGAPSYLVRDRAYLSLRASELAQVLARSRTERIDREEVRAKSAGSAEELRERLAAAEQSLAAEEPTPAAGVRPNATGVVSIKDEPRGTVLTVPSQLLFLSDSADFLPGASDRLKPIAEALSEEKAKKILVETSDNTGLAFRRADRVRHFLVSHEVAPDRVSLAGAEPAESAPTVGRPIVVNLASTS